MDVSTAVGLSRGLNALFIPCKSVCSWHSCSPRPSGFPELQAQPSQWPTRSLWPPPSPHSLHQPTHLRPSPLFPPHGHPCCPSNTPGRSLTLQLCKLPFPLPKSSPLGVHGSPPSPWGPYLNVTFAGRPFLRPHSKIRSTALLCSNSALCFIFLPNNCHHLTHFSFIFFNSCL